MAKKTIGFNDKTISNEKTINMSDPKLRLDTQEATAKHRFPIIEEPGSSTRPFRRLRYMYGAVTQIELNNFLEISSVDPEERKQEIKTKWLKSAEVFQDLIGSEAGISDMISARPVSSEASMYLEEIQRNPAFVKTFSNFPLTIEEIEIDKIVASQRTVNMDYVEQLKSNYTRWGKDIFNFCLHPGQDQTPIKEGRTAPNAFTFSSENPGLRFLGQYTQPYQASIMESHHPGGQPIHAVILLLGYGVSTINVYRVGSRIILNNGFHRLFALRSLGISYAPVVAQRITHPELELPPHIADLPREYVINAPRPGLMKDFFDQRLFCEVLQQNFIKSLQIGWGVNENMVPR